MFEEPEAREKIKNIFKNISNFDKELVSEFKWALRYDEPIGLYVATKDQSDVSWVFGEEEVGRMLGGKKVLDGITEELFPTEEDREKGVVLAILKKVGPIYAVRLEKAVLEEVFF